VNAINGKITTKALLLFALSGYLFTDKQYSGNCKVKITVSKPNYLLSK